MTEKKTKKGGGGKLNRTQTVTIRLDPKLRYLTALAARTQRRTTSGFIEWAIENSLKEVEVYSESGDPIFLADIGNSLWDVEESDRFLKLAIAFPHLLTHNEQIIWKIVTTYIIPRECRSFDDVDIQHKLKVHEQWDELNAIASDTADNSTLIDKLIPS